jgi:hypothetical protein
MKINYRRIIGCWNDKLAQERSKMERRQHGMEMGKFTPEQRNQLMLKK